MVVLLLDENDSSVVKEHLILVNAVEEIVKQCVCDTIKELGGCSCETCYMNACALALNSLKPQYVTSSKGAKITEVTSMKLSNHTEILVAVTKAVQQVMNSPRH